MVPSVKHPTDSRWPSSVWTRVACWFSEPIGPIVRTWRECRMVPPQMVPPRMVPPQMVPPRMVPPQMVPPQMVPPQMVPP